MSEYAPECLPRLEEILPHEGPVLLLHEVLSYDREGICCRVRVEQQRWLRQRDGSVPGWVGLEYMAQCIAAHQGLRAWIENISPRLGVLATARSVRFRRSRFEATEELRVCVRRIRGRPELGVLAYACEIRGERGERDAPPLAEGALTVALVRPPE